MTDALATSILQTRRRNKLTWYEDQIRKRAHSLAAIFKELRDDAEKPWLASHSDFETYCEEVWGMTSRRLLQIATGDATRAMLSGTTPEVAAIAATMNEGQLRPLAGLAPQVAAQVVEKASTTAKAAGKTMTANTIRAAKAAVVDPTGSTSTPSAQLEFSFQVEAATEDIEWFKALSKADRGKVISEARQRATATAP